MRTTASLTSLNAAGMEMTGEDTRMNWHLMKNYFTVSLMMLHDFQDWCPYFTFCSFMQWCTCKLGQRWLYPQTLLVMTAGPLNKLFCIDLHISILWYSILCFSISHCSVYIPWNVIINNEVLGKKHLYFGCWTSENIQRYCQPLIYWPSGQVGKKCCIGHCSHLSHIPPTVWWWLAHTTTSSGCLTAAKGGM